MAVSSKSFITGHLRDYPLYKDVIIPLTDWVLNATEDQFKYITNKYSNYLELDEVVATELISELGYGYLLDAIILNSTDRRIILSYLKLFHLLKGTEDGLRFVFELLGYTYSELEWFENANTEIFFSRRQLMGLDPLPVDLPTEPYTFKVMITILLNDYNSVKLSKFKKFTRYYVYPVLRELLVNIVVDFAEIKQGMGIYKDKIVTMNSSFNSSLYTSMVIYKDKTVVCTPLVI